ncbi:MAG: HAD-IIA family hydrolase [Marmoricola sp.]
MLKSTDGPLTSRYDVAALDLDGVVYVGRSAVPDAPAALASAAEAGMRVAFVTNNASRTPELVAAHLRELGIHARAEDVVTSAQAAARLLRRLAGPGDRVYVIGAVGLEEALRERDLVPVTDGAGGEPVAVVQGYGPDMPWRQVVRGAMLVKDGLPWVATNTDMTIPTAAGLGPGNGTLVRLVAEFAGRSPEVAGKPEPALFEETLDRVAGERPLMVGDRADTDIAGANRLGWDSLLVLTGVTGLAELVALAPESRPCYIAGDLGALDQPHPRPVDEGDRHVLGGWRAGIERGRLVVAGNGGHDDWWRCVATTAWAHLDRAGDPPDIDGLQPPDRAHR